MDELWKMTAMELKTRIRERNISVRELKDRETTAASEKLIEHLLEKFYRGEYGVWVAQTPALSVLDWGINAFESDEELVRFFAMHGYSITGNRDQELFQKAMEESAEFPHFPAEGSIADMGDYIIVHF